ncbi:hypothetical protein [Cellulomonas bogoriensis]
MLDLIGCTEDVLGEHGNALGGQVGCSAFHAHIASLAQYPVCDPRQFNCVPGQIQELSLDLGECRTRVLADDLQCL